MMDHTEDSPDYADAESTAQTNRPTRLNYEQTIREVKEKEKELTQRTIALENMVRTLTQSLAATQLKEAVPIEQTPPDTPFSLRFSTLGNLHASTNSPVGTNNNSCPTGYSKAYLRDALELVPKYDGHNIPIWQFTRACKRAKEAVALIDEALFVRMLRNKLTHHAYLAVEDEMHTTVDKFLDALKRTFGPGRSSNYYRGQLSITYKKPNEHILDYIGRIRDLRTAIIEGDQANLDRALMAPEIVSIDSFALEAFYEGLPREYRIELRSEGYSNLSDAYTKTIAISKRLEREEARNRNTRGPRDEAYNTARLPQQQNNNGMKPVILNSNSASPNGAKICNYCKKMGHMVHECRKRQFREGQNINNNTGNQREAPANGTSRGPATTRPINILDYSPIPSTSSEEIMETYPLLK